MKDALSDGWCSHLDLIPINFILFFKHYYRNIIAIAHLFSFYAKIQLHRDENNRT